MSGTFLLQCGAPNPRGIVKWTGVRFSDVADMLGLIPEVHYCRFVASDRFYADEPMTTLRHPQVMLAWLMNDEPIPPQHGAPLRLIVPFRYGNRSVKAVTRDDVLDARAAHAAAPGLTTRARRAGLDSRVAPVAARSRPPSRAGRPGADMDGVLEGRRASGPRTRDRRSFAPAKTPRPAREGVLVRW